MLTVKYHNDNMKVRDQTNKIIQGTQYHMKYNYLGVRGCKKNHTLIILNINNVNKCWKKVYKYNGASIIP